ncbi:uncharacterized protein PV09_09136 [Verruconis gallopava]|uniref:ZW10 C-terminal helical domain-containing protein n=1 Tax=Verruconis gallopava TaxID=253628 RepID=A0A0D2AJR6_9PEZI|nr:uncharacterized protein PV09_09136 [Verruconis gallopava]KIV99183.1 hypothetical protein PV09_09136 [Verruconis gallopava]
MASTASEEELVDVLVNFVEYSTYPTSEHVASASLPNSALPPLLNGIRKGQESIKAELRELSRNTAGDLDGWISQAKQLQHDIEESKVTAKKILQEEARCEELYEKEQDAASKANLLRKELDFNETLIGALEQIKIATGLLDKAKDAESENELLLAVKELDNSQKVTAQLDSLQSSRFGGLLSRRTAQVKDGLNAKITKTWATLVQCNHEERKIIISNELDASGGQVNLDDTIAAMQEIGSLETHLSRFYRELDTLIIGPRFSPAADGSNAELYVKQGEILVSGRSENRSLEVLAGDAKKLILFLQECFPEEAFKVLLEKLLPNFLVQLVNEQLDPSVPVTVNYLVSYGPSLEHIQSLAAFIEKLGVDVPSDGDLSQWIDRLPQNWLSRRREGALDALRTACYDAVNISKISERVETQMIASDDVIVTGEQKDETWNDDWNEDDEKAVNDQDTSGPSKADGDGEEAEGWDWDDGDENDLAEQDQQARESGKAKNDDEDAEGWGWGDDEVDHPQDKAAESAPSKTQVPSRLPQSGEQENKSSGSPRPITQQEITLRETFRISAIPDTLLDLINKVLQDASDISQPEFPIAEIAAAVAALSPIPTLLLALYRATARSFYSRSPVADILIYNDSTELARRLERLLEELPSDHPLARRLPRAIESEIKNLESFSRLAYGREMDSQRTILSDLLSSTSGFENCTNPVNAREYQSALDDVVSRLREIDALWKDVLCESARKQSIGALISHVIRKVVQDILELASEPAGISEPESKQLKIYIDNIAKLSDLFNVISPDGEERSLVHVYTPSWLRFVYLGEILEASLADIKFLWTEGELSLEYESDEVIELIQALFAESEHRKEAIREIKKSARMSGEFGR